MRVLHFATILLASACLASRSVPVGTLEGCRVGQCPPSDDVQVTYLGVAGFLIESGDHVLMTGPHFTNPPLRDVLPREFGGKSPRIKPNRKLIRTLLAPTRASHARTILIGHGHYDHAMDVPFIAQSIATKATIHGGPTVYNMLVGDSLIAERVSPIPVDWAGRVDKCGTWITTDDRAFRFMALHADHSPTVKWRSITIRFAKGVVTGELGRLPARAEEWKEGEVYAYLIDVLAADGRTPVFRIYFQDTANNDSLGFPPTSLGGDVDLALLAVANAHSVTPPAPDALLKALQPKFVIAGHWESFFETQLKPIRPSAASRVREFAASLAQHRPDSGWAMPMPMTTFHFRVAR